MYRARAFVISASIVLSGVGETNILGIEFTSVEQATPSTQKRALQAANANWRVSVMNAAKYTKGREKVDPVVQPGTFNLLVELQFEYLGPEGEVAAPALKVIDQNGKEFPAAGNISGRGLGDFELINWLMSITYPKAATRSLKPSTAIGPITFYIGRLPLTVRELRLAFADVPAFPISVKEPGPDGQVSLAK